MVQPLSLASPREPSCVVRSSSLYQAPSGAAPVCNPNSLPHPSPQPGEGAHRAVTTRQDQHRCERREVGTHGGRTGSRGLPQGPRGSPGSLWQPKAPGEGVGTCGQSGSARTLYHKRPGPWPAEPPQAWPDHWRGREGRRRLVLSRSPLGKPLPRVFSHHPRGTLLLREALKHGLGASPSLQQGVRPGRTAHPSLCGEGSSLP